MLPWNYITENALNLANVMNDIVDPNNPKDVTWYVRQEDGSLQEVTIPNLAKAFQDAVDGLKNDLDSVVQQYIMFSSEPPSNNVNPPNVGFIYVKYDSESPNNSEIYICVDNTEDNNVWGRISGGALVIDVTDDMDINTGVQYFVDTSTKSINLTLPANPNHNDTVMIGDGRNNAQNNPVNVLRNGKLINDKDEDLICDVNSFYVILRYDQNGSWYVTNAITNS